MVMSEKFQDFLFSNINFAMETNFEHYLDTEKKLYETEVSIYWLSLSID